MKFSSLTYKERAQHCTAPIAKHLFTLMDEKQTNLALSADVTKAHDLLKLADELGPEICMLKTHIDIIEDFTTTLTKDLRELAKKHRFILFEDRKFADIGNTVKQQYAGGIYKIVEWADIINTHILPGPGIIEGLANVGLKQERGLVLLAEMSSQGHLMDQDYIQQTLTMAEHFPEFVIGFISQQAVDPHPRWINMTPGVKLDSGKDSLGQQYITPHKAIMEQGSDIIIVGRGIISSTNPKEIARQYRVTSWEAYKNRCKKSELCSA